MKQTQGIVDIVLIGETIVLITVKSQSCKVLCQENSLIVLRISSELTSKGQITIIQKLCLAKELASQSPYRRTLVSLSLYQECKVYSQMSHSVALSWVKQPLRLDNCPNLRKNYHLWMPPALQREQRSIIDKEIMPSTPTTHIARWATSISLITSQDRCDASLRASCWCKVST